MPIEVRAVAREEFNTWAEQAKTRFAEGLPPGPPASALAGRAPASTLNVAAAAAPDTVAAARR
jgi:heme/copper-type cytochrome/quinol oxidase subunit 2